MSDDIPNPLLEPIEIKNHDSMLRASVLGGDVAIAEKLNEAIAVINQIGRAVECMAIWLVQAGTGFTAHDQEQVFKVLRGRQ